MKNKIISINRDNLYDMVDLIELIPEIEEGVTKVYWYDAKKNELLEPRSITEKFPEQIFPIKIVKYGNIYFVSSVDEIKPLPPNQKEQLILLIKSLLPVDSVVNISA